MSEKITLKEFWKSKDKLAINCATHKQSIKLLKEFNKMGKHWANGESYLNTDCWYAYYEQSCYCNRGHFRTIVAYQKYGYKILKFDDIDMTNTIN